MEKSETSKNKYWYSPLPKTGSVDKDGKSIEKQPNFNKKFTYEEIKALGCNYVRRVNPGFVFFDFDKPELAAIMDKIVKDQGLKCKRLTTTRGAHFMFKTEHGKISDGSGPNWLGIDCDLKGVGTDQPRKINCQVIRLHDEDRPEEYIGFDKMRAEDGSLDVTDDDLDYAPFYLYHTPKAARETVDQALGMASGDGGGRNNWFHHEYAKFCKMAKFTWEQYHQASVLINRFVFGEALSDDELTTATRQEEYDDLKVGSKEEKPLILMQAEDVIETWNCKMYNGEILFFNDELGHYDSYVEVLRRYLQRKYSDNNITTQKIDEIMKQVVIILNTEREYQVMRSEEYVVCKDRLVSTLRDETREMTRSIVTDIVYPFSFMTPSEIEAYEKKGQELVNKAKLDKLSGRFKEEKAPKRDENGKVIGPEGTTYKFIKEISCFDSKVETVILEALGCMLAPVKKLPKIFIFYGSGANGKSKLLDLMREIMGPLMTSANILNINDNFALQNVYKGIANVTDDVGITTLRETGLFKSLIDGTDIEVNIKHKDPILWKPNSQFVMCCNEIPRIADSTKGMIRRLSFVPFEMQLTKDDMDVFLLDKMRNEPGNNGLRYLMSKAIMAYRAAIARGDLTELDRQKELEEDFLEENKDRISQFLEYMIEENGGDLDAGICDKNLGWLNQVFAQELYTDYVQWCQRNFDSKIETQKTFSTRFKKKLPSNWTTIVKKFEGKSYKVYVNKLQYGEFKLENKTTQI